MRETFLEVMRQVPGAVAIVATRFGGERRGLTSTSWCSLSTEPPSVLVCVNKAASAHDLIVEARKFSINQLCADDTELVAIFSNRRGLTGDARFQPGLWEEGMAGLPVLRAAVSVMECDLVDQHDHGTHHVFVGRVEALHLSKREPLVYVNSGYARAAPLEQA